MLFRFRNAIAHGKSEIVKAEKEVREDIDPYEHFPKAEWEEFCTLKNAKRAKEDVDAMVDELHSVAGLGEFPYIHGVGSGSVSAE